jgi:putative glycosyltransferase (TIGR04348 family)
VVVLTGTDLYADIAHDAQAQASLALADRLVVLQPLALRSVPAPWRAKVDVVVQSSPARRTLAKPRRHLRALMVGHLRSEKSPETYWAAARRLAGRADIRLDHIGGPLDPALAEAARACMAECPRYRWLGALPHGEARRRIQQAHVLVHPSRLEGGAHVVIEAVTSGTPVLASRIDGNLGLLGESYEGCFDWGDDAALAALLARCRDDPAMLARLQARCAERAPLFAPDQERAALHALVHRLLENPA